MSTRGSGSAAGVWRGYVEAASPDRNEDDPGLDRVHPIAGARRTAAKWIWFLAPLAPDGEVGER
jgi:hypothetical protein